MYQIFGKKSCPSCDKAKALLESNGVDYQYKLLDKDFTLAELFSLCPVVPRSFPQVFYGDDYIGGLKELQAYIEKGD